MEEDGETPPPFWLQSTTTHRRTHRRTSSLFLNSGVLIVVLPITALILIFIIIPYFFSLTSQIFRPNLVKKSWDSLNLLLVLFAILCGLLGRRGDDDGANVDENTNVSKEENHQQSSQDQWFEYSDRGIYNSNDSSSNNSKMVGKLRRSSSSYPDLRQESSWASVDDKWRFFDDNDVYNYQSRSNYAHRRRRHGKESETKDVGFKTIPVDTFEIRTQESTSSPLPPPPPSTPPPPAPPPPPKIKEKTRSTFRTLSHKEKAENSDFKKIRLPPPPPSTSTPPSPPPPPPLPLPPLSDGSKQKSSKSERKRGSAAKDIASTLASIYNQRKKKKSRQKSKENYDDILQTLPYLQSGSPPPPPPPPPPPSSVFHQLFKKGHKSKRIHSLSSSTPPPPPPPPPPPTPPRQTSSSRSSKRKIQTKPPSTVAPEPRPTPSTDYSRKSNPIGSGRPPLPTKIISLYEEENLNSGGQSPLIPMPPPPPPPPFRMADFKFVVRGDYVRIRSNHSSRGTSPDLDQVDLSSSQESTNITSTINGEDESVSSVFCPSPDVNTKADTFIASFRAGLRLEKVKSVKEKQELGINGSVLEPRPSPTTSPVLS